MSPSRPYVLCFPASFTEAGRSEGTAVALLSATPTTHARLTALHSAAGALDVSVGDLEYVRFQDRSVRLLGVGSIQITEIRERVLNRPAFAPFWLDGEIVPASWLIAPLSTARSLAVRPHEPEAAFSWVYRSPFERTEWTRALSTSDLAEIGYFSARAEDDRATALAALAAIAPARAEAVLRQRVDIIGAQVPPVPPRLSPATLATLLNSADRGLRESAIERLDLEQPGKARGY